MDNQNTAPNVTPDPKPLDITAQPTALPNPVPSVATPVVPPTNPPVENKEIVKESSNGKNKLLYIIVVIVIVLLVTGGAILAYLLLNNSNNTNTSQNNSNTEVDNTNEDTDNDDTASDQLPDSDENVDDICEVNTYTTKNYPDFSFEYNCDWVLVEDEVTEVTTDIFTDGVPYKKHDITLRKDNSELFFTINEVVWEGYPTCFDTVYEDIGNRVIRTLDSELMGNTIYKYYGNVDFAGTEEFNEDLEVWYPEGSESYTYCHVKEIPFVTESIVVSESEVGIPAGQNFYMHVFVDLAVDNTDTLQDILDAADLVVGSMEN